MWNKLQAANLHIEELEQQLAQKDTKCCKLQSELKKSKQKLQNYQNGSSHWKTKQEETHHELHM